MKKAVWITFFVAIVLVNGIAELVYYFSDFYIVMFFRIALILGITMIASIFVGTSVLLGKLETERPRSQQVHDTLGADKAFADNKATRTNSGAHKQADKPSKPAGRQ